jgi:hypothetical protein
MVDERTGQIHDYTRRTGVVSSELILPDGIQFTTEEVFNMSEEAEKRKDARTWREVMIALPQELDEDQRRELAREYAAYIVQYYGVAVECSIHLPDEDGDKRNHHAHLSMTTRQISAEGLGAKSDIERDEKTLHDEGKPSGRKQVELLREEWANMCNRALARAGLDVQIDHRSYDRQGIGREPTIHMGYVATDMERDGARTRLGDINRAIKARNEEREGEREGLDGTLLNVELELQAVRKEFEQLYQQDYQNDAPLTEKQDGTPEEKQQESQWHELQFADEPPLAELESVEPVAPAEAAKKEEQPITTHGAALAAFEKRMEGERPGWKDERRQIQGAKLYDGLGQELESLEQLRGLALLSKEKADEARDAREKAGWFAYKEKKCLDAENSKHRRDYEERATRYNALHDKIEHLREPWELHKQHKKAFEESPELAMYNEYIQSPQGQAERQERERKQQALKEYNRVYKEFDRALRNAPGTKDEREMSVKQLMYRWSGADDKQAFEKDTLLQLRRQLQSLQKGRSR